MAAPVVQLERLDKRFGAVRALKDVSVAIPPGPVGLLGPNGAGKSTLLKLLLGQLEPTSGRALIAGADPRTRAGRLAVRSRVGYMPEGDCLIPGMNAVELVVTLGRTSGLSKDDAITRAHEVLDYVGLDEERYRGLDEYSSGMKQRLKLAQALAHDPDILLLDEPTNGLDPKGRRHMLELIRDLGHAQKKNLLVCSHLLPDIERTCAEVVVIHRGEVLAVGGIAEMTRREASWMRAEVTGDADAFARELTERALAFEREEPRRFRVRVPEDDGDLLFTCARAGGATLTGLKPVVSSLEEVFLATLDDADREPGRTGSA